MSWLNGKKTYIVAAAMGIVTALHYAAIIDDNTFQTLVVILTGGGLAALRDGVARSAK